MSFRTVLALFAVAAFTKTTLGVPLPSFPGAGSMSLDDPSASAGDDDLAAWLSQITGSSIDREVLCHSTGADGQTYAEKTRQAAQDVLIAVGDSTEEYCNIFMDEEIYWNMNTKCVQEISSGEHSCDDFATLAMNPQSEFGHSYPEIHTSFPDSPTDEEMQEGWSNVLASLYAYKKVVSKINGLEERYTCRHEKSTCLTGSPGSSSGQGHYNNHPGQKEQELICSLIDRNQFVLTRMETLEGNIKRLMSKAGITVTVRDDTIDTIQACTGRSCHCNMRMYSLGGLSKVKLYADTPRALLDTICPSAGN